MTRTDAYGLDNTNETAVGLRTIVDLLRRQMRLIVLTLVIALGVALAYLVTVAPTYTAQTLIMFDPVRTNLLDAEQSYSSAQTDNSRIESEVEILRAPSTALAVVEQANLISDPEFGPRIGLRDRVLSAIGLGDDRVESGDALLNALIIEFQEATRINRRGLTYLIAVEVTAEDPERAARLANTIAEVYIDAQVQAKVASSLRARDVLQAQIEAARDGLAASDLALDGFIETNLAELEAEGGSPELARLRDELEALRGSQLSAQVTADAAAAALEQEDFASLAARLGDAALANLAQERDQLARQLGQIASGTQAEVDLRAALAALEGDIEDRAAAQIGNLRSELTVLDAQVVDFRSDLRAELLQSDLSSESVAQIFELQQEASIARRQYQNLLSRVRDLEIQASLQVADSRVVSPALAPHEPSAPNVALILAAALMAGLGFGTGFAFLNEYYVGGVTSVAQLAALVPATVGASIPLETDKIGARRSFADRVTTQPLSLYAEAIRRLRASLDESWRKRGLIGRAQDPAAPQEGRLVMITSAVPAEGKTTLALALARTYAVSGKKTLLIDADLRQPSVHTQVGTQPEFGLIDYLKDPDALIEYLENPDHTEVDSEFYTQDGETGLSLLLGAKPADVPTDQLLSSSIFEYVLDQARQRFDIVVIDTSPLLPVVDARYVAHFADAVVMPVRCAATSQTDLRSAYRALAESTDGATDLFTVLSHQAQQPNSYTY